MIGRRHCGDADLHQGLGAWRGHGQHTMVDKELEDYMKNQFLNEDAEVTEASKT